MPAAPLKRIRDVVPVPPDTAAPLKRLPDQLSVSWTVTPHAVRRYIERVRHGASFAKARSELIWMLERAHFVKPLLNGIELWRGPKPLRLRLRVDGRRLVTVIEDCDARRARQ